jgi:SAM-dependent methyltransferase
MSQEKYRIKGSFRDPLGTVYEQDGRIFRTVQENKSQEFEKILNQQFLRNWVHEKKFIETTKISNSQTPDFLKSVNGCCVFEHPRLDFISYPYEWCYAQLRDAAIFFLKLQLEALEYDVVFKDSSAYNIQFIGPNPIFIDALSLRPYVPNEYWQGYYQFCKEFLYPILLSYYNNVPPSDFYRGNIHGIDAALTSKLLPLRSRSSLWVNVHVHMSAASNTRSAVRKRSSFDKNSYVFLLKSLLKFISKLEKPTTRTVWGDYTNLTSYAEEDMQQKTTFVKQFIEENKIRSLIDLGCNDGFYSQLAFDSQNNGNNIFVVGVDGDEEAIIQCYQAAKLRQVNLTNLKIDLMSPSPSTGFMCEERESLLHRQSFDASLALALIHHLIIGCGANMEGAVRFLTSFSRIGVIEFVEKDDPRVQQMLMHREDVFTGYDIANFTRALSRVCEISGQNQISKHRHLFSYRRRLTRLA